MSREEKRIFRGNNRRFLRYGFTLVELLVVISVLVILLSITIYGYGAWRDRVAVNEVTNDLKAVKSVMNDARNFSDGYPTSIPSTFTASDHVTVTRLSGSTTTYCIRARSIERPSITYYVTQTSEPSTTVCS